MYHQFFRHPYCNFIFFPPSVLLCTTLSTISYFHFPPQAFFSLTVCIFPTPMWSLPSYDSLPGFLAGVSCGLAGMKQPSGRREVKRWTGNPQELWRMGKEGCSWCSVATLGMRLGDWIWGNGRAHHYPPIKGHLCSLYSLATVKRDAMNMAEQLSVE